MEYALKIHCRSPFRIFKSFSIYGSEIVTAEPNADVIIKELVHAITILIDASALRMGACGVKEGDSLS
jgi:hypothetical protein